MELWHVLNRSIEGRDLFSDSKDFVRFVHNLYQFNDSTPALQSVRRQAPDSTSVGFTKPNNQRNRDRLVDIHGWVLMKNHYHLLLSERAEGGLSLFLRKLNVGYANYFNERHKRSGALFQGRTKKVLVKRHAHLLYLLHYLHFNPLDYLHSARDWRIRNKDKRGILNVNKALDYLNSYRWSSYLDYCGKKNFPSILTTSFFAEVLDDLRLGMTHYLKDAEYVGGGETQKLALENLKGDD